MYAIIRGMINKYSEQQIQEMIELIKKRFPNRPELATREFAIMTLDNSGSISESLVSNLKTVAKKENNKSKTKRN